MRYSRQPKEVTQVWNHKLEKEPADRRVELRAFLIEQHPLSLGGRKERVDSRT